MEASVFTRTYSYRERKDRNSLENYSTELLVYCLNLDDCFRNELFALLGIKGVYKYIDSQVEYSELNIIVDLEIVTSMETVFCECKIEDSLSQRQLNKYSNLLSWSMKKLSPNGAKEFRVVVLSKYRVEPLLNDMVGIRWFDVSKALSSAQSDICKQFNLFLKDKEISMSYDFSDKDLILFKGMRDLIMKMDHYFTFLTDEFADIGVLEKSARMTQLRNYKDGYYNIIHGNRTKGVVVSCGFFWEPDAEEFNVKAGVCFEFDQQWENEFRESIEANLSHWEPLKLNGGRRICYGFYVQVLPSGINLADSELLAKKVLPEVSKFKKFWLLTNEIRRRN